jgi:hypothetical protein
MTYPITPDPAIHDPSAANAGSPNAGNQAVTQLRQIFGQLPELILKQVIAFIKQETGIDLSVLEPLILDPINTAISLLTNGLAGIDLTNTGAVLNAIESAIANFFSTIVQQIIDTVINALTGGHAVGGGIEAIGLAFQQALRALNVIPASIGAVAQDLAALIATLEGRVHATEQNVASLQQASGGVTLTSGYDDCSTAAGFTTVVGTPVILNGAIRTPSLWVGYHTLGPNSDKQGIKFRVTHKYPGFTRGIICADSAMTNYAAIEIRAGGFANDYVRLVTGVGPNEVVTQSVNGAPLQVDGRISNDWVYELKYDPSSNTYFVYRNGTEMTELRFTDSTNQVTHGSTKQHVGLATNCASNPLQPGFAITDYSYYVWS